MERWRSIRQRAVFLTLYYPAQMHRSLEPATISSMLTRVAYRQFHDQTNVAVATSVVLAEFGLVGIDLSKPRQELTLHGLIQRGIYAEDRGLVLRNALRYLAVAGLQWTVLHDAARTAAIETRIKNAEPDYTFQFFRDLKSPADSGLHLESA